MDPTDGRDPTEIFDTFDAAENTEESSDILLRSDGSLRGVPGICAVDAARADEVGVPGETLLLLR